MIYFEFWYKILQDCPNFHSLIKNAFMLQAHVTLSSAYGFGRAGCPTFGIPGAIDGSTGSKLTYDVYLKSFERAKESWQLDGEQKVEQARLLKDKGTLFFKVMYAGFQKVLS